MRLLLSSFIYSLSTAICAVVSTVDQLTTTPAPPQVTKPPHLQLKHKLMHSYDRTVRSNRNATEVVVDPVIYSIVDVDEARESLIVAQWFEITWGDDLLTWNPADYDGIKQIRLLQSAVWIPDITIYQLLQSHRPTGVDESFLTVNYNGTIFLSRAENVIIHCGFEVGNFPYDTQNCTLTYVAWAYPREEMVLAAGPKPKMDYFQDSAEWMLVNYTSSADVVDYGIGWWYEVTYRVQITRKPFYYIITLTVPSFFITNLAIIGVFSPSSSQQDRHEKVSVGLTALLTMAVILMMVSDLMPKNATSFPKLGKYILFEMGIMGACTVLAVCIMYLASQGKFGRKVPWWLSMPFSYKRRHKRRSKLVTECFDYAPRSDECHSPLLVREPVLGSVHPTTTTTTTTTTMTTQNGQLDNDTTHLRNKKNFRPVRITAENIQAEIYLQLVTLTHTIRSLQAHILNTEIEEENAKQIEHEWMLLTFRLDFLCLSIAIAINAYATFYFSI